MMRTPLILVNLCLGFLWSTGVRAEDPPVRPAPKFTTQVLDYFGPNGVSADNGDIKLVEKVKDIKLVWRSEEDGIGFGKAHSSAAATGYGFGLPPSGASQPILADGLLIQMYSLPTGNVVAKDIQDRLGERFDKFRSFAAVDADDVVIAIDAATGKTKWKTVFPGKGVNRTPGKRGEFAVAPCSFDGKVYAFGTTGRLYALELATGKVLWESSIGTMHKQLEKLKTECLKQSKSFEQLVIGKDRVSDVTAPCGALLMVEGVLLVPDWQKGLLGINPKDGSELWHATAPNGVLSSYNAPAAITIEGKTYLATVNVIGEIRLIDHRNGKILWTHALESMHHLSPIFGKELLLVMDKAEGSTARLPFGVLAGYKLTLTGATRVWKLDEKKYPIPMWMDSGPTRRVTTRRDGTIIYSAWNYLNQETAGHPPFGETAKLAIVNESDGKILSEVTRTQHYCVTYLWGDKLFFLNDIQHGDHDRWRIYSTKDGQLTQVDEDRFPAEGSRANNTLLRVVGYEFVQHEIFADGYMFVRENRAKGPWGGIACYDLRASTK
jgi:outer membrane protein assembly factor BamB